MPHPIRSGVTLHRQSVNKYGWNGSIRRILGAGPKLRQALGTAAFAA
jgi:hypothetical protein